MVLHCKSIPNQIHHHLIFTFPLPKQCTTINFSPLHLKYPNLQNNPQPPKTQTHNPFLCQIRALHHSSHLKSTMAALPHHRASPNPINPTEPTIITKLTISNLPSPCSHLPSLSIILFPINQTTNQTYQAPHLLIPKAHGVDQSSATPLQPSHRWSASTHSAKPKPRHALAGVVPSHHKL